jgi:hypothetical protein
MVILPEHVLDLVHDHLQPPFLFFLFLTLLIDLIFLASDHSKYLQCGSSERQCCNDSVSDLFDYIADKHVSHLISDPLYHLAN